MARRRGGGEAVNRGAMLAALGACRDAVVREMPNMKPMGPLYHFASGVLAAIAGLATLDTRPDLLPRLGDDRIRGATGRP